MKNNFQKLQQNITYISAHYRLIGNELFVQHSSLNFSCLQLMQRLCWTYHGPSSRSFNIEAPPRELSPLRSNHANLYKAVSCDGVALAVSEKVNESCYSWNFIFYLCFVIGQPTQTLIHVVMLILSERDSRHPWWWNRCIEFQCAAPFFVLSWLSFTQPYLLSVTCSGVIESSQYTNNLHIDSF